MQSTEERCIVGEGFLVTQGCRKAYCEASDEMDPSQSPNLCFNRMQGSIMATDRPSPDGADSLAAKLPYLAASIYGVLSPCSDTAYLGNEPRDRSHQAERLPNTSSLVRIALAGSAPRVAQQLVGAYLRCRSIEPNPAFLTTHVAPFPNPARSDQFPSSLFAAGGR